MAKGGAGTWVPAVLAPAVFLAVDPSGWYPFGPAKWLVTSVLVLVGAALVLRDRPARIDPALGWSVLVLLALLAVAAAHGADSTYAWIGTPEREFGVATWCLCALALVTGRSLDVHRDGRRLAVGLVVAGVGVGAIAVAESLGIHSGPIGEGASRLTSTLGSSAYLGDVAALLLPACVGAALDRGFGSWVRRTAAVGAGGLAVAALGSGARAAWVGLLASGLAVAWARRRWLADRARAVAVVVGLGVVGLVAIVALTPVGHRAASVLDADAPGGRGRVDEWRVATRVIARHPVLGVGPEGYRTSFAEGADAAYERAHGRDPLPDRAHSAVLDVALDGGVGAAVAWMVLLGLIGRSLWRAMRGGQPWVAGLAVGLAAHWIGQLLLFPTMEVEPVAWLLAGFVVAATTTAGERDRARTFRLARAAPALAGALTVVALLAGTAGVVADRRAEAAARALGRDDAPAALDGALDAVRWRPDVVRYRLLLSRAEVAAGRGAVGGLDPVDAALRWSPRDPIVQRERARLLVARAAATQVPTHARTARAYLRSLLHHDPVNAELWLLAGQAAGVDGDATEAERAWRRAEELAPRNAEPSVDLARLYADEGRLVAARRAIARALRRDPADREARSLRRRLGTG